MSIHPANLIAHAPDHPGFDAPECPLRSVIVAHIYGTSRDGYGCDYTGGHCVPDGYCDKRRAKASGASA